MILNHILLALLSLLVWSNGRIRPEKRHFDYIRAIESARRWIFCFTNKPRILFRWYNCYCLTNLMCLMIGKTMFSVNLGILIGFFKIKSGIMNHSILIKLHFPFPLTGWTGNNSTWSWILPIWFWVKGLIRNLLRKMMRMNIRVAPWFFPMWGRATGLKGRQEKIEFFIISEGSNVKEWRNASFCVKFSSHAPETKIF